MDQPGRPTFGVQVFENYEFRLFPNYPRLDGLQICRKFVNTEE